MTRCPPKDFAVYSYVGEDLFTWTREQARARGISVSEFVRGAIQYQREVLGEEPPVSAKTRYARALLGRNTVQPTERRK